MSSSKPFIVLHIGTKWTLFRKQPLQQIASFPSEFEAYSARRAIMNFEEQTQ